MKNLTLYILYLQFYLYQPLLIENKKTCCDCKYFNPNSMECKKFGETDLITGETINKKARIVRYDETHCGKEGKYFEKNYFKIITVPYYFLISNSFLPLSILLSFVTSIFTIIYF